MAIPFNGTYRIRTVQGGNTMYMTVENGAPVLKERSSILSNRDLWYFQQLSVADTSYGFIFWHLASGASMGVGQELRDENVMLMFTQESQLNDSWWGEVINQLRLEVPGSQDGFRIFNTVDTPAVRYLFFDSGTQPPTLKSSVNSQGDVFIFERVESL